MAKQTPSRVIAEAAKNQFMSSLDMLRTLVDVCPDAVWRSCYFGFSYPAWYQVYHTAYFVDYWLQEDYRGKKAFCMTFDSRIPPEFEHEPDDGLMIPRAQMRAYLELLSAKAARFFDGLTDEMMSREITDHSKNHTYTDVVCCQIRHVMYNIGYLNAVLRSLNLEESDWYDYNEINE